MTDIYSVSKWPYVSIAAISNHIGFYPKKELNELYVEKKITVHESIKGKIVKLLIKKTDV